MRTIIIATVIAITVGIIYQKVTDENIGIKEIAGYVTGTASQVINETSKAINDKDVSGIREEVSSITENIAGILQDKKEEFIKEALPEMANIDVQKILQNVPCDKALSIYENYVSGKNAQNKNEENVYAVLDIMREKGENDNSLKNNITKLFCDNKN